MRQQSKWRLLVASVGLCLFFGAIQLYMSALAKEEQTKLRADIFEVQKNIAEQMSGDYDMGLKLVDELIVENDYFNQRVMYEVLDEIIADTPEAELEGTLTAFMENDPGTLNIYGLSSGDLLFSVGQTPFYIPQPNLSMVKKELTPGTYQVLENPFLGMSDDEGLSHLYYYYAKSKPWLMVIKRPYMDQSGLKASAKAMVSENMNQVHKYLGYELLVMDKQLRVVKASDPALVGQLMIPDQVEERLSINSGTGLNGGGELQTFKLIGGNGESRKYMGIVSPSGENQIVFATDKVKFLAEYGKLSRMLLAAMVINALLALYAIKLIIHNYLYYLEGQSMGGESS